VLEVSERFACRMAGQHRTTQRHEPVAGTPDDPDAALRAWLHLIAELDRRAVQRGAYPAALRCDNGPELACSAMADWANG